MARIAGSSGEKTLKAIYEAATDLIYQNGYEAVSLRQLAGVVGIQAGSLYNHIVSKQDLLHKLTSNILLELNASLDHALRDIDDPEQALRAFIRFHIEYYVARKKEVFIGNFELRSLKVDNYKQIVTLRDQYEKRLRSILLRGVEQGYWADIDMGVTAKAHIAMLTGVCVWYDPKGGLTIEELVDHYTALVFSGIRQNQGSPSDWAHKGD